MVIDTGLTLHPLGKRGLVRDWLAAGPWSDPVTTLGCHVAAEGDPFGPRGRWVLSKNPEADEVKLAVGAEEPRFGEPVTAASEGQPVGWCGREGVWYRRRVGEDGFVDWSGFAFTPERRVSLAAVVVRVPVAGRRTLRLVSTGSLALFIDGATTYRDVTGRSQDPLERSVDVHLPAGDHLLAVATSVIGMREYRHVLSLAVDGAPVSVVLPSADADPQRSAEAEALLDDVGVDGPTSTNDCWTLTGPDGLELLVEHERGRQQITLDGGRATLNLERDGEDARPLSMARRGERRLRIRPTDPRSRACRTFSVMRLPADYRAYPAGRPEDWAREIVCHVADADDSVSRALARTQLGQAPIRAQELDDSIGMITDRADCADFEVLALLNLVHRAPQSAWPNETRERAAEAVVGFKYWLDDPGLDCMCYFTENHQLIYHAAELLAGEAFPDAVFANTGRRGRWHADRAQPRCAAWIDDRLRHGFVEFDSNTYLAIDVLALVSLIEFCGSEELRAAAIALTDKLLFQLAANSWRGIHGSAHGRSYAQALISGRVEETSPLQRLTWGVGSLNEALLPAVVLAAAQRYRVPDVIRKAGTHLPEEWWGRQRSEGRYDFRRDLRRGEWSSASVVWKTPDGMLASVQDHRPREPGYQEHVWQATLSPEAIVFANHPANASTDSSARPNYWAGNRVLPRVRQDRDALISLFDLPSDDPMGFVHGWFPTTAMDEWRRQGPWFTGRVGDGYVALWADGALRLRHSGATAGHEVRPDGGGRSWVCQLGRRRTHGSFTTFCDSLQTPTVRDAVTYRTPDGRTLELGWETPWRVNDREVDPLDEFPHLRNPMTDTPMGAERMTIALDGDVHELDLVTGRRR